MLLCVRRVSLVMVNEGERATDAQQKRRRERRQLLAERAAKAALEDREDRRYALAAAASASASPAKIIERAEALLAWLKVPASMG